MLFSPAGVDATGDIAALAAQRQALQAQANVVFGSRDSTLAQILLTQDRLGALRDSSSATPSPSPTWIANRPISAPES